jgi:WD40 repeat protein
VETGECQYALTDHTDDIKSIVYSPSGRQIISGSEDGTARLWDVDTGVCSQVFHHGDRTYISKVVFSPQGNLIASGDWSGKVKLWEVGTGRCRHTLNGHVKRVETIAFSPRGNLIFSSSVDGEARLWDTETGVCRWTHHYDTPRRYREQRKANGVAWIDSDTTEMDAFVTGGRDGSVRMWEVIEEEGGSGSCRVRMRWRSTTGQLTVEDACLKDVQGLSHLNRRLLKQRGAVGEPVLHFRETGKTGLTVGTVGTVSAKSKVVLPKKGQQDTATVSLSAFAPRSARPLGQPMEKWMDAQDRRLSM